MIRVLAGVNGAGKSSVLGRWLRARGGDYFNPDEVAALLVEWVPGLELAEAQKDAWGRGFRRLVAAIDARVNFNFETTLAGASMAAELERALGLGLEVGLLYVGLDTFERHLSRVRTRVAHGGHDIDPERIRHRLGASLANLVRLASRVTELHILDNSVECTPTADRLPEPRHLLHVSQGVVRHSVSRVDLPAWAVAVFDAVGAP
jgi:predicted ABC-type ATPase